MDKLLKGILRFRSSVKPGMLQSLQQVAKKASVSGFGIFCVNTLQHSHNMVSHEVQILLVEQWASIDKIVTDTYRKNVTKVLSLYVNNGRVKDHGKEGRVRSHKGVEI